MWMRQYKKTFVGMQTVIVLITLAVHFQMYRSLQLTLFFFLVLQGAALAGALWASRLKRRINHHAH